MLWLLITAVICGFFGGLFARLLGKGLAAYLPAFMRGFVRRHPVIVAFILGLLLAALGTFTNHQTYGTGYAVVTQALNDQALDDSVGIAKLFATVFTYWSGIAGGILHRH